MIRLLLVLISTLIFIRASPVDNDKFIESKYTKLSWGLLRDQQSEIAKMFRLVADQRSYDEFDYMSIQGERDHQRALERSALNVELDPALRKMYRQWLDDMEPLENEGPVSDISIPVITEEEGEGLTQYRISQFERYLARPALPLNTISALKLSGTLNITARGLEMLKSVNNLQQIREQVDSLVDELESKTRILYDNAGREMPTAKGVFNVNLIRELSILPEDNVMIPRLRSFAGSYLLLQSILEADSYEIDDLFTDVMSFMNLKFAHSDMEDENVLQVYQSSESQGNADEKFLFVEYFFGNYYFIDKVGLDGLAAKITLLKPRIVLLKYNLCLSDSIFQDASDIRREFGPLALQKFDQFDQMANQVQMFYAKLEPLFRLEEIYSIPERLDEINESESRNGFSLKGIMSSISVNPFPRQEDGWISGARDLFLFYQVDIPNEIPNINQQRVIVNEISRIYHTNLVSNMLKSEFTFVQDATRLYSRFVLTLVCAQPEMDKIAEACIDASECLNNFRDELTAKQDVIAKRSGGKLISEWNLYFDQKSMKGRLTKLLGQCNRQYKDSFQRYFQMTSGLRQAEDRMLEVLKMDILASSKSVAALMNLKEHHLRSAKEMMIKFNTFSVKYGLI